MTKYRSTAKVYKKGNLYWDIEVYKNDRWEVLIPYLSLDEAIYLMSDHKKLESLRRLIKLTYVAAVFFVISVVGTIWMVTH